jgi:hypothetical protein
MEVWEVRARIRPAAGVFPRLRGGDARRRESGGDGFPKDEISRLNYPAAKKLPVTPPSQSHQPPTKETYI